MKNTQFLPNITEFRKLCKTMSYNQLAKHYGVVKSTISSFIKKNNINYINKTVKSKITKEEAILFNEKGLSIKEIAKYKNINKADVTYYFSKYKIKIANTFKNKALKIDKDKIIELIENNYTFSDLTKYFQLTKGQMYNILEKYNLKCINRGYLKYNFSEEQINYIKRLLLEGAPVEYISTLIGVNCYSINKIREQFNIKTDKKFIYSLIGYSNFKKEHGDKTLEEINSLFLNEISKYVEESKKYQYSCKTKYYKEKYDIIPDSAKKILNKNKTKWQKDGISAKEISSLTGISEYKAKRFMTLNSIFPYPNRNFYSMPGSKQFKKDISNAYLSNAFLAEKYKVSNNVIAKWRKQLFGKDFRFKYNLKEMTSAERRIAEILEKNNIVFFHNKKVGKSLVDFDLGFNFLIDVQGTYWHKNKTKKDCQKKEYFEKQNYILYQIDEEDIINNLEKVENNLLKLFYRSVQKVISEKKYLVNSEMEVSDINQANGSELSD